ncbi:2',5'-phosphodiesterase 12-like [Diadema antillarum]|uniref:2',5'-phosphodiesterase 12-like n=1 Tax=Diadema antillarum TaxID=105358 RepID=UPI003A87D7FB
MNFMKSLGRVLRTFIKSRPPPAVFASEKEIVMGRAFVRCIDGEGDMSISFKYRDKQSSLLRPQTEVVGKALSRIQCTMKKHFEKEMKKRKKMKLDLATSEATNVVDSEPVVSLCMDDVQVDLEKCNRAAWIDGAVLCINDTSFSVCRNYPKILQLSLPTVSLVGCPVFPRVVTEFTAVDACKYRWFRCVKKSDSEHGVNDSKQLNKTSVVHSGSNDEWIEVGQEKTYTPSVRDVGSKLKLVCLPRNGIKEGEEKHVVMMRDVQNGPATYPFEKRHAFTNERTSQECFRIMSYNILADTYADSDYSRDFLYPYCPAAALDIDYREQLLLKEISGYNADILCLQECGKKLFQHCLKPAFSDQGFEGLLLCKGKEMPEGEALFYRTDKFRLIEQFDASLAKAFETESANLDLLEGVSKSPAMLNQVLTRTSVVQVAILEDIHNPTRLLCVANTHLYFHPRAGHIRLIQAIVILRHIQRIQQQYAIKLPECKLALVLCGDLNCQTSDPGVFELISKKHISPNHVQWYAGGKAEFCGGMTLTHDLDFTNACMSQRYTNFVAGFVASLDYILIDSHHLSVIREIPMPSHDDIISHVALPNQVFPSDHLAIGCEVKWEQSGKL